MPTGRGGKINIKIPARLTGLLQLELQPENNSTYSVLACLPSPYVFLFTIDSKKLNVCMNYSGGPNIEGLHASGEGERVIALEPW